MLKKACLENALSQRSLPAMAYDKSQDYSVNYVVALRQKNNNIKLQSTDSGTPLGQDSASEQGDQTSGLVLLS